MINTRASNHYAGQLLRSGSSPALNYGETQSAESKKDFIHKMSIILKELRESLICLTNIKRKKFLVQSCLFQMHYMNATNWFFL